MQGETAWWRQHCHYWPVAVAGRELHATGPVESHRSVSNFRRADDSRISTQTACLASTPAKQGLRFSGSWHVMTILTYVNPFYNAHTSTNTVKSTLAGNSSGIFFKMQMCTAVRCSESCSKCAADRRNQKVETPQASPGSPCRPFGWNPGTFRFAHHISPQNMPSVTYMDLHELTISYHNLLCFAIVTVVNSRVLVIFFVISGVVKHHRALWASNALHFLSSFWEAAATKTPGSCHRTAVHRENKTQWRETVLITGSWTSWEFRTGKSWRKVPGKVLAALFGSFATKNNGFMYLQNIMTSEYILSLAENPGLKHLKTMCQTLIPISNNLHEFPEFHESPVSPVSAVCLSRKTCPWLCPCPLIWTAQCPGPHWPHRPHRPEPQPAQTTTPNQESQPDSPGPEWNLRSSDPNFPDSELPDWYFPDLNWSTLLAMLHPSRRVELQLLQVLEQVLQVQVGPVLPPQQPNLQDTRLPWKVC